MYTRLCGECGLSLSYTTKAGLQRAETAKSKCRKCVNSAMNKLKKVDKQNNPAWTGYKDIPGKVFSRLKNGAKQRNLDFEITIEDIWYQYVTQNKKCAFSSVPIEFGLDASIDRIDSSKGYWKHNIQIVHKTLNMMKKIYLTIYLYRGVKW